jgi:hypothetical protein
VSSLGKSAGNKSALTAPPQKIAHQTADRDSARPGNIDRRSTSCQDNTHLVRRNLAVFGHQIFLEKPERYCMKSTHIPCTAKLFCPVISMNAGCGESIKPSLVFTDFR